MKNTYSKLNLILVVLISIITISYLVFPVVGSDSGYYLATAREVYQGKIYFIDIASVYNPLAIIIVGLPYLFSSHPDFKIFLLIDLSILFLSAIVLYNILKSIHKQKSVVVFFTLYFVVLSLMLDGSQLMLEPISVLFQLIALYYYLNYKKKTTTSSLVLAGFFIALSFLSKQYGLFILIPIGLDILFHKKNIVKSGSAMGLGLVIPVALMMFYLVHHGATLEESVAYMIGKGVQLERGNGTGINFTCATYLLGFAYFIMCSSCFLFLPILWYKLKERMNQLKSMYLLIFPFSFLVLINASYLHYFQYVTPYLIIALVYLITISDFEFSKKLHASYIFSLIVIAGFSAYSIYKRPAKVQEAVLEQKILLANIPAHSVVYLDGISPAYYYLCDYKSIDLKKIGFCFPGYFTARTIFNSMPAHSYIIASKTSLPVYKDLAPNNKTIKAVTINGALFYCIKKNK